MGKFSDKDRPTSGLRPDEVTRPKTNPEQRAEPSIELVSALLERVETHGSHYLRLGLIVACERILEEMKREETGRDRVLWLRELVELLGKEMKGAGGERVERLKHLVEMLDKLPWG